MAEALGTVAELRVALDGGALSAVELARRSAARGAALDATLNATRSWRARAEEEAAASDARRARGEKLSALDGIPVAIKD